jgi:hypothetical protein
MCLNTPVLALAAVRCDQFRNVHLHKIVQGSPYHTELRIKFSRSIILYKSCLLILEDWDFDGSVYPADALCPLCTSPSCVFFFRCVSATRRGGVQAVSYFLHHQVAHHFGNKDKQVFNLRHFFWCGCKLCFLTQVVPLFGAAVRNYFTLYSP